MENNQSVAKLIDSTTSKIQQLQKAFAELESHRAVTLNVKWKQLEEHFHGLEKSLKRRFTELEDQEKDFDMKITESNEMLERREAAVLCKERASLERLQLKRDAAVSAIAMAMVSESNVEEQTSSENGFMEVKSYPELIQLCKQMDSENLHKFISDNRKNLAVIKEEIPFALKAASNPASLVLDSLKGFYCPEMSISDAKKDANLLGLRRTCIMLMECLSALLATLKNDSLKNIITEIVKKQAKDIAEGWKVMLEELDVDASNGNSLEAHAFLQLLATFGIDSHFDQHNLIKLIPMVCRRHQTAELCRFLGLSDKMPGVINVLVNNGRQIDAVNLAVSFGLTEQFSPVTLLKSYLSEATKVSSPVKDGNASSVQNDVIEKELSAIKAVIKCSEENKLGAEIPLEPLQKRVLQLEKAKADKKRGTEVAKPQSKRPRANGGGYGPHKNNMYARTTTDQQRHPHYMYDNRSSPYCYPVQPPVTAPYHPNFFANGFQYQAPYLH